VTGTYFHRLSATVKQASQRGIHSREPAEVCSSPICGIENPDDPGLSAFLRGNLGTRLTTARVDVYASQVKFPGRGRDRSGLAVRTRHQPDARAT